MTVHSMKHYAIVYVLIMTTFSIRPMLVNHTHGRKIFPNKLFCGRFSTHQELSKKTTKKLNAFIESNITKQMEPSEWETKLDQLMDSHTAEKNALLNNLDAIIQLKDPDRLICRIKSKAEQKQHAKEVISFITCTTLMLPSAAVTAKLGISSLLYTLFLMSPTAVSESLAESLLHLTIGIPCAWISTFSLALITVGFFDKAQLTLNTMGENDPTLNILTNMSLLKTSIQKRTKIEE